MGGGGGGVGGVVSFRPSSHTYYLILGLLAVEKICSCTK